MTIENLLENYIKENSYPRTLKSLAVTQGSFLHVKFEQQDCINFSSSDYLGLSHHPLLIERASEYAQKYGAGSSASRLITGNLDIYENLENTIAKVLNKPTALIMGTGYQTNFSVVQSLLDKTILKKSPWVFCDKLIHNSVFNGFQEAERIIRYTHNNYTHLENLLKKYHHISSPKFIFAESVYSMDGDKADLLKLTALSKKYNAFLYIDDAHAVGVLGESGWGLAKQYSQDIPIIMGTFSKALGGFGGYIACSHVIKNYLINKCKGLIYSTGLPPAVLGAISAAIELVPSLDEKRKKVMLYAQQLRNLFDELHINYGHSDTHIVPWIIGEADQTVQKAQALLDHGILALAIRPPSVPAHQSRIRFCLSSEHSEGDIQKLFDVMRKVARNL